jgi:hypothetical protein
MINNYWVEIPLAILGAILLFGIPIFIALKLNELFEKYCTRKILPLLEEGARLSSLDQSYPITQYALVYMGHFSREWSQVIFVDKSNIVAITDLIFRTTRVSYKLSAISIIGFLFGSFMIFINYNTAMRKLKLYASRFSE